MFNIDHNIQTIRPPTGSQEKYAAGYESKKILDIEPSDKNHCFDGKMIYSLTLSKHPKYEKYYNF